MKTRRPAKTPKSCRECSHWYEVKERVRITDLVAKAIAGIEERLKQADFKPTLGDYLKLVQLERELEQEGQETREIKVTWVETPVESGSEK